MRTSHRTSMRLAAIGTAALFLAQVANTSASTIYTPDRLGIYYGYPSAVNGSTTNAEAAAVFGQFDVIVLGAGINESTHPDHSNTTAIIADSAMTGTEVFGYVDIGVSTSNLTLSAMETDVDEWKAMGVDGIFFDNYGYDFLTPRSRQNAMVSYAHSEGLKVFANAFVPEDALASTVDSTYNPTGVDPELGAVSGDIYLLENLTREVDFTTETSDYRAFSIWNDLEDRAGSLTYAVENSSIDYDVRLFAVDTNNDCSGDIQDEINFSYLGAVIRELDGWQYTNVNFSAFGNCKDELAFHQVPLNIGTSYTNSFVHRSGTLARKTDDSELVLSQIEGDPGSSSWRISPVNDAGGRVTVSLDADMNEWIGFPKMLTDADDTSVKADFKNITFANDGSYIYLRVETYDAFTPDFNFNIFMDTDSDPSTGFSTGGLGAEYLIQGTTLYELDAGFNPSSLGALTVYPTSGSTSDLQIRISRSDIEMGSADDTMYVRFVNDATGGDTVPDDVLGFFSYTTFN